MVPEQISVVFSGEHQPHQRVEDIYNAHGHVEVQQWVVQRRQVSTCE